MSRQNKIIIASIVVLAVISSVSLGGVIYLGSKLAIQSPQPLASYPPALPTPKAPTLLPTPTAGETATPTPATIPVVVYEAEGSFSLGDKDQIIARVVNPFLDYYKELSVSSQQLVSLTVSINSGASKANYPYQGRGVFDKGAIQSFLISKTANGIEWWLPECLNGCNLSDKFKTKYPEIAARVQ